MPEGPLVSVIVPTLNSGQTIGVCLKSIFTQTYSPIEVIVVDKNSRDDTADIAKKMGARVLVVDASERCEQMNIGIDRANGRYVYRVDSDFVLDPTVVEEAVAACEVGGFDGVCVHNTSDETVSFWAKVRKLERDCYADDDLNVAARFVKRDALLDIGCFDTSLVACEDYDLHNRLIRKGYKMGRISSKETHLGEPKTLGEIVRKHYYYGKTLTAYVSKEGGGSAGQLSPFRPAFVKHWRDFAKHPILSIGFIAYQVSRYSASAMGYISAKLRA